MKNLKLNRKLSSAEIKKKEALTAKNSGRTVSQQVRDIVRTVGVAVHNFVNEGREINYPWQTFEQDWKKQWFRTTHPTFRKRAEDFHQQKEKTLRDLKTATSSLANVSIGAEYGTGGTVCLETFQKKKQEKKNLSPEAFKKNVMARVYEKIANGGEMGKKWEQKLKDGYEEKLDERIRSSRSRFSEVLEENIKNIQKEYESRCDKLKFLEKRN